MADFLAVKKLSKSDLTLLDRFFGTINDSGQKCINLNARPFSKDSVAEKAFYPDITSLTADAGGEAKIDLSILGPAGRATPHALTRKITKGDTYKNWRLNGETIHDPKTDPDRYASLQEHDLALMAFEGKGVPTAVRLVYLARAEPADAAAYAALAPLLATRSMIALSPEQLGAALAAAAVPGTHPASLFATDQELEEALEDAALGGSAGQRILRKRRGGRTMTAAEAEDRRKAAAQAGADGESLVNSWLERLANPGGTVSFEWSSKNDPEGPLDFRLSTYGGQLGTGEIKIDVKSTNGPFGRLFHLSMGEVLEAAESAVPYEIWRVYDVGPLGASMRRSGDIRDFAKRLVDACSSSMPPGVRPEDFTIQPAAPGLTWSGEIPLAPSPAPEDDDTDEVQESPIGPLFQKFRG